MKGTARQTFRTLMVLERLETSERSSTSKELMTELGLVGLAVSVGLLIGVVRFLFRDVSVVQLSDDWEDMDGDSPQPKGILIV